MSFQRAAVNCKRCYEIALHIEKHRERVNRFRMNPFDTPEEVERTRIYNEQLIGARNLAMKALEETKQDTSSILASCPEREEATRVNCKVEELLDACMNCDYSKPTITERSYPRKPEEKN